MRLPTENHGKEFESRGSNSCCQDRQACTDDGVLVHTLLIKVEDAAVLLGIGRTSAYELVMRGVIPSVKIGRRRLVIRSALEEYVRGLLAAQ